MKDLIEQTRSYYRERVALNPQAVRWSVQDALDQLIRFERLDAMMSAVDHTDHDAPCLACFYEGEMSAMLGLTG